MSQIKNKKRKVGVFIETRLIDGQYHRIEIRRGRKLRDSGSRDLGIIPAPILVTPRLPSLLGQALGLVR